MRAIQNVRILGPIRCATQVELSKTDGIYLGINLPTRMSGDIKGSAPVTVVGPRGSVQLSEGAIRAMRHIHMHPTDADRFQVRDKEIVDIEIPGESGIILKNVTIRVNEEYRLELHIDTDEGNAANISTGAFCKIIK
jgi:propanediol utilization protein